MRRVLYILRTFPALSETYIRTEIEALARDHAVRVVSFRHAEVPYATTVPRHRLKRNWSIRLLIRLWRPDVLHTHWLVNVERVSRLGVPYTVRTHSFDVLGPSVAELAKLAPRLNDELCLGVLAFPFARRKLERAGIRPEKIHDCFPVVDYERFHDRSSNGDGVMNVGACLPKKRMEDFLELARRVDGVPFRLYAVGGESDEIRKRNHRLGSPVEVMAPIDPAKMAREFKRHRWLVYTACPRLKTVGWPLSVAEAQASGTGVCVPNIRPDMKDYVGDAGFLYDSIDEVASLVAGPVPDDMRERGFERARRSDIRGHLQLLTGLWAT